MRSAVAGKPRVHELAKELGVESKVVLAKLQEMGEYVKSASSTVEAPVARRLRAIMEEAAATAPPAAPTAPTTGKSRAGGTKAGTKAGAPTKTTASKEPVPGPPAAKPTSAHDIEVAAAEARAAALKAEQEAARAAAARGDTATPSPATGGQ